MSGQEARQVGGITSKIMDPKQSANRNRSSPDTGIEKEAAGRRRSGEFEDPGVHRKREASETLYHERQGPERGRGAEGKGERVIEGRGGFVCENGGSEERDLTRQGTNTLGASSLLGHHPHATGDTPRTAAPIGFTGAPRPVYICPASPLSRDREGADGDGILALPAVAGDAMGGRRSTYLAGPHDEP